MNIGPGAMKRQRGDDCMTIMVGFQATFKQVVDFLAKSKTEEGTGVACAICTKGDLLSNIPECKCEDGARCVRCFEGDAMNDDEEGIEDDKMGLFSDIAHNVSFAMPPYHVKIMAYWCCSKASYKYAIGIPIFSHSRQACFDGADPTPIHDLKKIEETLSDMCTIMTDGTSTIGMLMMQDDCMNCS